ncbi:hypothetical protein [Streptomyces bambusae]|uniref:Uncharacterized protein n=1 Tax=Streptomyces bambusae TaxID=1550616 RepID=A0ABS6ZEP3_9ACTN|nr:hypothetical protein [Streptomyces bambusae]MBW5485120.1 hypothetical protein [Streptomyces bambusae]
MCLSGDAEGRGARAAQEAAPRGDAELDAGDAVRRVELDLRLPPAGRARRIRAERAPTVITGNVRGGPLATGSTAPGPPTRPRLRPTRPTPAEPPADGIPRAVGDGTPRAAGEDVRAARDATIVLGDVHDSALGDGSERR